VILSEFQGCDLRIGHIDRPPIGHFQFSSGVRAIPVPGGFANGLGLREGDRECVGLSEREFKLTALN
jgi:hypothetical protein